MNSMLGIHYGVKIKGVFVCEYSGTEIPCKFTAYSMGYGFG